VCVISRVDILIVCVRVGRRRGVPVGRGAGCSVHGVAEQLAAARPIVRTADQPIGSGRLLRPQTDLPHKGQVIWRSARYHEILHKIVLYEILQRPTPGPL
jgi:hypothetical protein